MRVMVSDVNHGTYACRRCITHTAQLACRGSLLARRLASATALSEPVSMQHQPDAI